MFFLSLCTRFIGIRYATYPEGKRCANLDAVLGRGACQLGGPAVPVKCFEAPVVIATVHDVGYALCEIAENPRHTSNNGVSRLAKAVRHWRIAAGLTQTAVAKQSGVNRSYLSHLESGRRNPTLATLQRLAKILNVAPGYFL